MLVSCVLVHKNGPENICKIYNCLQYAFCYINIIFIYFFIYIDNFILYKRLGAA